MDAGDATPSDVSPGEELTVLVMRGKSDSIISRMRDGRVILFNRESPLFPQLRPGTVVHGRVIFVAQNYVIVDPLIPPHSGAEAVEMGLRLVAESENWEMAVLANALLHILDVLGELPGERAR